MKCAEQLKNSSFSVLLIEKNKIIGPKICAGGLTGLCGKYGFSESKIRSFTKIIFYISDKKHKEVELSFPIKIIDRYDLGQYLLDKIKDSKNITVSKETLAKEIKKDRVITNKGDFYYKYLVGADGSYSLVRRFLGLKSKISIGMYYEVPEIMDNLMIYFYPKLLKSIYIWAFPHKNHTNIGIGLHLDSKHLTLKQSKKILEKFLKKNGFAYSEKEFKAAPLNSYCKGCVFGNVFLVGDAAGLVSKFIGEGISYALISGEEIGKRILKPGYEMPELKKALKIKKKEERFGKIFESLPFFRGFFLKFYINLSKTYLGRSRFPFFY